MQTQEQTDKINLMRFLVWLTLPLTYILTLKTNLGYLGAWISIIFSVIITNLILILILYRSKIDEIIENIYN